MRVAARHQAVEATAHYRQRLIAIGAEQALVQAIERADDARPADSPRLAAILRHTDLLATRPAGASPDDLQALADAGLTTDAIVTLSQTIAFVSFQVRVVAALKLLGAESNRSIASNTTSETTARFPVGESAQRTKSVAAGAVVLRPGPEL